MPDQPAEDQATQATPEEASEAPEKTGGTLELLNGPGDSVELPVHAHIERDADEQGELITVTIPDAAGIHPTIDEFAFHWPDGTTTRLWQWDRTPTGPGPLNLVLKNRQVA